MTEKTMSIRSEDSTAIGPTPDRCRLATCTRRMGAIVGITLLASACSIEVTGGSEPSALAFDDGVVRDGQAAPLLREPTGCPAQNPADPELTDVLVLARTDEDGCLVIEVFDAASANAQLLRQTEGFLSLEKAATFSIDSDPLLNEQWGHDRMVVVPSRSEALGDGVLVAVIDTGVDLDHPDLVENLVVGFDFTGTDSQGDDDNGHGTHIAGVIAAGQNRLGVEGVSPRAKVLPIKVLDEQGIGQSFAVSQGLVTAVDLGADIVNLSLSGYETSADLNHALDYALDHGVVVVASAGNGAGTANRYPAAFDGVIAVSALDKSGELAAFASTGSHIAFAGPGTEILSTTIDGHAMMSGSSMAAAHVSGAVAAVMSQPKWGLLSRLFSTSEDLGESGRDDLYGVGVINLAAAIDIVVPAPPGISVAGSSTQAITTMVAAPTTSSIASTMTTTQPPRSTTTTARPTSTTTTARPPTTTTTTTSTTTTTTTTTQPPRTTTTVPATTTTNIVITVPPIDPPDDLCWTPLVFEGDQTESKIFFDFEWGFDCEDYAYQWQRGYWFVRHDGTVKASNNAGGGVTNRNYKTLFIVDPDDEYGEQRVCLRVRPGEQAEEGGVTALGPWSDWVCGIGEL